MNFKTVFDLTTAKSSLLIGYLPLVYLCIIGISLIFVYTRIRKRLQKNNNQLIALGFISIFFYFILVFMLRQFSDGRKIKQIMEDRNYFIVEGTPENYHPMPKEGHDNERFDINGIHFEYSDFVINAAGYNHAASLGGVITPENYYRLTFYKVNDINSNRILKIEIRQ
jgi:hypothetical protein